MCQSWVLSSPRPSAPRQTQSQGRVLFLNLMLETRLQMINPSHQLRVGDAQVKGYFYLTMFKQV